MPNHAGFAILIFQNEFEFIPSTAVLACRDQPIGCDQSISGEKPCVLRTSCATRRTVAGYQAASQVRVADPCLIESDLRPRQCAVDFFVGSFDLESIAHES